MRNHVNLAICYILLTIFGKVYSQEAIFLHQSTGSLLFKEGKVASWIDSYNQSNGTSIEVSERLFPYDPWTYNYPFDYWKLWVGGSCNSSDPDIECLNTLVATYDMVIMKHCSPASHIQEDTGTPDVTSDAKRLENYKEQYRALRSLFDSYPNTKFMVWTLAPLHRLSTSPTKAARANQFVQWVKNEWLTEDGKYHPNIIIFDFYSLAAELDENPVNGVRYCLKYEYEKSHTDGESHPNTLANETIAPVFAQLIVNTIGAIQQVNVTGITINSAGGANTITTAGGTLQLSAAIKPDNATHKAVTWSIKNGTGQASISVAGLVTAIANGTVTASATANDGSGIKGDLTITISGQTILVNGITVTGPGGATSITTKSGTLQLTATISPADATNKTITWSIQNGTGQASISADGIVTAIADGTATVTATTTDGSGIKGELAITIENQNIQSGINNRSSEQLAVTISQSELKIKIDDYSKYRYICFFSLSGNLILSRKVVQDMNLFDVSFLPSGIYIIEFLGDDFKKDMKVVKP